MVRTGVSVGLIVGSYFKERTDLGVGLFLDSLSNILVHGKTLAVCRLVRKEV